MLNPAEWEAHLDRLEDAADRASVEQSVAERQRPGEAGCRRLCHSLEQPVQIGDGASRLAELSPSTAAFQRTAKVLRVPMETPMSS